MLFKFIYFLSLCPAQQCTIKGWWFDVMVMCENIVFFMSESYENDSTLPDGIHEQNPRVKVSIYIANLISEPFVKLC